MTGDKKRNISHAKNAIEEAASKGAKLVLLPVSLLLDFDCFVGKKHKLVILSKWGFKSIQCDWLFQEIWNSPYSNDSFPVYAEDIDAGGDASPSTAMLSEVSKRLKITIIGGSIPERFGDRLYNTCCVFGPDGELKAKHRKVWFFSR